MGFYDDASLIFLAGAEAGKDGKAYSVKPTDGDGDFTFSRGSNLAATRVGADGLIEKGRENLLLQSNQFDTTWVKSNTSVTSGHSGYDGSSDAWKLIQNTTNGFHFVYQNVSVSSICTLSIYAKAGEYSGISFFFPNLGGTSTATTFNLSTGTFVTNTHNATSESVGNGWYRISLLSNTTAVATQNFNIYVNQTIQQGEAGDGTSGIYIQDAQLEIGLAATDVIESGATTGKAGLLEDEPRFDYSGGATCPSLLLEPSRTNLIEYSEYFSTDYSSSGALFIENATTSPEGVVNATTFEGSGTLTYIRLAYSIIFSSAGDHTLSLFAKAGTNDFFACYFEGFTGASGDSLAYFDLSDGTTPTSGASIEAVGTDGWYRCSITANIDSGDLAGNLVVLCTPSTSGLFYPTAGDADGKNIQIYGFQVEQGSYPTSYIPNHSGGSVTRGAEASSVTGASSLIGQTEGTILCEFKIDELGNNIDILAINNSTNSEYIAIFKYTSNVVRSRIRANSISNTIDHLITATGTYKVALKYNASTFSLFINGVKMNEIAATISFASTIERIFVGPALYVGLGKAKYGQLLTLTEALSDADCITLTT